MSINMSMLLVGGEVRQILKDHNYDQQVKPMLSKPLAVFLLVMSVGIGIGVGELIRMDRASKGVNDDSALYSIIGAIVGLCGAIWLITGIRAIDKHHMSDNAAIAKVMQIVGKYGVEEVLSRDDVNALLKLTDERTQVAIRKRNS